jgi:hypothetical protein
MYEVGGAALPRCIGRRGGPAHPRSRRRGSGVGSLASVVPRKPGWVELASVDVARMGGAVSGDARPWGYGYFSPPPTKGLERAREKRIVRTVLRGEPVQEPGDAAGRDRPRGLADPAKSGLVACASRSRRGDPGGSLRLGLGPQVAGESHELRRHGDRLRCLPDARRVASDSWSTPRAALARGEPSAPPPRSRPGVRAIADGSWVRYPTGTPFRSLIKTSRMPQYHWLLDGQFPPHHDQTHIEA